MPAVHGAVIKERAARLREAGDAQVQAHLKSQIGTRHNILMENAQMGRTEAFTEVHFTAPQEVGQIITTTITGQNGKQLLVL